MHSLVNVSSDRPLQAQTGSMWAPQNMGSGLHTPASLLPPRIASPHAPKGYKQKKSEGQFPPSRPPQLSRIMWLYVRFNQLI